MLQCYYVPDYPRDRLDVKFILEADDLETQGAVAACAWDEMYDIVLVPREGPRTKPKALNVALARARGAFCAIYDAEDRPHPQQVRAALDAFAAGDERLACVQAPLAADNLDAGWLARQFAAEYAIQFGEILPLLARLGLPLPLGGTSNHFRVDVLREIGGWDSYNVTEDADLGYRLARKGYKVGVIAPPTWEEAPVRLGAWTRQRARWIKGHMQTWLVLMRHPLRTLRELGLGGFLAMQLVLGGGVAAAFAHGPLALVVMVSALTPLNLLGPQDFALAVFGYATAIYGGLVGAAYMRDPRLALAAFTMPFYWPLATPAACRAFIELVLRPHFWAKTMHGIATRPALPRGAPARTPA